MRRAGFRPYDAAERGGSMSLKPWDKIDDVANDLDNLSTTVDEIKHDPPADVEPAAIDTLKHAIEKATDAVDVLENQKD
jgi:hypothetical protein